MKIYNSNSDREYRLNTFIFLLIFWLVFGMSSRTPLESDVWWHLRAGQEMVQRQQVLTRDVFSFTRMGEEWINHSWLAQIVLYYAYTWGSYLGLGLFTSILATFSMMTLYPQMSGHPLLRGIIIIFASLVAAPLWSPRPQMFSLLFLGITALFLSRFKARKEDRLWLLPLVFMFWSNLHGGYILGLLLIGATILGEVLNHILEVEENDKLPWKVIARMILWFVVCWFVVIINPNGWKMWLIPFKTFQVEVLQKFISEWASPDFHRIEQQPFLWLLIATLIAIGLSERRMNGSEVVRLSIFTYLGLYSRRNFAPFALVATPIFAFYFNTSLNNWLLRLKQFGFGNAINPLSESESIRNFDLIRENLRKWLNRLILVIIAVLSCLKLYWVTTPEFVWEYERKLFPVEAINWIKTNQPQGNMFNSYNWGGYLDWHLPEYLVFVDGRTDLYDDFILKEYITVYQGNQGWNLILDKYQIHFVLIEKESPLSSALYTSTEWQQAYQDDLAVVYIRSNLP